MVEVIFIDKTTVFDGIGECRIMDITESDFSLLCLIDPLWMYDDLYFYNGFLTEC